MTVTVYGASDDVIVVGGSVAEEFEYRADENNFLAFSDGTVLRVEFTRGGVWRVTPVVRGTAAMTIVQAPEGNQDDSDAATLDGPIVWVVHGNGFATAGV